LGWRVPRGTNIDDARMFSHVTSKTALRRGDHAGARAHHDDEE
jgi:hypothetical protein